jgi:flagellar basal-body rod protein FlgC
MERGGRDRKEYKMNKIIIGFIICLFLILGCSTQNGMTKDEPLEMKIILYGNNQREYLKNFILYKNYNVEMVDNGNYLSIKNITEEMLIEMHRIIRLKTDLISDNIENATTTKTVNGEPFRRKYLMVTVENGFEIIEDIETPLRYVYDPSHPDAIKNGEMKGYVRMPNIDMTMEMVDMVETTRLYEGILEYSKNNFKNVVW